MTSNSHKSCGGDQIKVVSWVVQPSFSMPQMFSGKVICPSTTSTWFPLTKNSWVINVTAYWPVTVMSWITCPLTVIGIPLQVTLLSPNSTLPNYWVWMIFSVCMATSWLLPSSLINFPVNII